MTGYVAISKDIKNSWVYTADDPCYFKWWFDLYTRAAYKEETRLIGKRIVRLHKRQLLDGIGSLSKRWKAGRKKVRAFIHNLVDTGMITFMSSHNVSIITIETGFPDGFCDPQDDPTRGTTSRRANRPSISDSYEDSACDYDDYGSYPEDYHGDYHGDYLGNDSPKDVKPSLQEDCEDENDYSVQSEPHLGNHLGTTSGTPSNNNKNNIYNPITQANAREKNFCEEEFFTNILKSNAGFVLRTKREFGLKEDSEVLGYLSEFLSEQQSYVRLDVSSGSRGLDVNRRLRNYQNHFRNWLRQKLLGRYRKYDPSMRGSASLNVNRFNNSNNPNTYANGFSIDPCKRDTTIIPTKGTREDFLKGFYAASE